MNCTFNFYCRNSFRSGEVRVKSRQARITWAPLLAKTRAVSAPMPVFAPVMITTLPVRSCLTRHFGPLK